MGSEKVNGWLSKIAARFRHFRSDVDLQEELQAHLAMQRKSTLTPVAGPPYYE